MIAKGKGASATPKCRRLEHFCERSWRAPILPHELSLTGAFLLSNLQLNVPPSGGGGDIREHETPDLKPLGHVPCRREDAAICMLFGYTAGRSSRIFFRGQWHAQSPPLFVAVAVLAFRYNPTANRDKTPKLRVNGRKEVREEEKRKEEGSYKGNRFARFSVSGPPPGIAIF